MISNMAIIRGSYLLAASRIEMTYIGACNIGVHENAVAQLWGDVVPNPLERVIVTTLTCDAFQRVLSRNVCNPIP
jgi:hypothetical protein